MSHMSNLQTVPFDMVAFDNAVARLKTIAECPVQMAVFPMLYTPTLDVPAAEGDGEIARPQPQKDEG